MVVALLVGALLLTTCGPRGEGYEVAAGPEPAAPVEIAELAPEAAPEVRQQAVRMSDSDGNGRIDPDELDAFFAALIAAEKQAEPVPGSSTTTVPPIVPRDGRVMPRIDTDDPQLFLTGDSVMQAVVPTVDRMLPSWSVNSDTRIGRRVPEGASVIEESDDQIGDAVVIVLGHNYTRGEGFQAQFNRIMRELWHVERVVWVTVAEWSPGQLEVNGILRTAPQIWPNVVIADWAELTHANPGYLAGDRVHLTSAGVVALADLIARAVGPGPIGGVPGIVRVDVPVAPDGPSGNDDDAGTGSDDDDEPTWRPTTTVAPTTTRPPLPTTTGVPASTTTVPASTTTALPTTTVPLPTTTVVVEPTTTVVTEPPTTEGPPTG
jgi:hypothetical protein